MTDKPRCLHCHSILEPSKFGAYKDKGTDDGLQFRCQYGCGRMWVLRKEELVLDLRWCDHDFLHKQLFSNGKPHPVHVSNFRKKHFSYLPEKRFRRSLEEAEKKYKLIAETRGRKKLSEDNPNQNTLW